MFNFAERYKVGIGLSVTLTAGLVVFFLLNLQNIVHSLNTIQSIHFPILEHTAISIRLEESMYVGLKQALNESSPQGVEDFVSSRDALVWNIRETRHLLGKEYGQIRFPSRDGLDRFEATLLKLANERKWKEASKILLSPEFVSARTVYTQELQRMTEDLSVIRDEEVLAKQRIFSHALVGSLIVTVFIVALWMAVISGYRENLKMRKAAEALFQEERLKSISQSKLASLGEMAGGIAHEINNPLAILSLHASKIVASAQQAEPNLESIVKSAGKMHDTIDRISRIIRGLRTLTRNSQSDPFTPAKLHDLIQETLELCRSRFLSHGISIEMSEFPQDWTIHCRPSEISQVLLNLLNNSFDALESLPEKWIRIEIARESSHFVISVTDSGSGIPAAIAEKIMNPFFTSKPVGKGTGLGLSISNGIAKAHHGSLSLDPQSKNTRFMLSLPIPAPEAFQLSA